MSEYSEMMAELDAIAAGHGIKWSGAEIAGSIEPTRTRYAQPGQRSGNGYVRLISPAQVRYVKRLMAERDTTNLVRLPGSEDIEGMSLTGARDLIDRLLACPVRPVTAPTFEAPSEAQASFLRTLLSQREVPAGTVTDGLDRRQTSALISILKAAPYARRETVQTAELESGMYLSAGTVYKVQRAVHGSGRMYAKRLVAVEPYVKTSRGKEVKVTHEFEYAAGAIAALTPAMRMTLDQAIEYGAVYGVCCRCARTLTDERSIEAGIGPVCASKF